MTGHLMGHAFVDLWHPGVFAWILLCQMAYLLLVGPMRERHGWGEAPTRRQKVWFSLGLWAVYLAEGTPLHVLSEQYLFSAHMVQHIILTAITPPLILLGTPGWFLRPVVRRTWTRYIARTITRPAPALLLFNLIYSIWHFPVAYEATLWWHGFHMVQHAILVFTAFLMWMPVCSPAPELPRLSELGQMFYLFVVGVSQIAVFGMITFSEHPFYDFYQQAPRVWPDFTPMVDQQVAGIIMKLGGMAIMLLAWGIIFFRWAAREGAMWDNPGSKTEAK